jgi:hypothetical protein
VLGASWADSGLDDSRHSCQLVMGRLGRGNAGHNTTAAGLRRVSDGITPFACSLLSSPLPRLPPTQIPDAEEAVPVHEGEAGRLHAVCAWTESASTHAHAACTRGVRLWP